MGELKVAEIAVTPAFALNAKFIIHTVGPRWNGGVSGETLALANCYRGALHKAKELGCNSIAFPLISSGVFKFPKDSALKIALQAIGEFLESNEMDVLHDRIPLASVAPLTEKEYYARGCTALLDAIGGAIHHIGNVHKYAREEDRAANYVNDGEGIKTMYMAECCLMSDIRKNRVNTRAWKRNVDADFARRGNK